MKERSKEMTQIMESGKNYVDKIHQSNDIIRDKAISQKLERMETIVAMIFHEVDINPKQADKLGLFLNYYLPTTEKLLNAYIDLDEKQVKGKSLDRAKREIENSLDTINTSFEAILDRFYQEQEMDIASDISAMEIMMKQDGIKED
jgi:5-bromo-4-chloroindolyl phosphate hydrolysis protein